MAHHLPVEVLQVPLPAGLQAQEPPHHADLQRVGGQEVDARAPVPARADDIGGAHPGGQLPGGDEPPRVLGVDEPIAGGGLQRADGRGGAQPRVGSGVGELEVL